MDFRFYLSLFRRRLHWFIIVAVIVSGIGIMLARYLPTVYIAQATLVVESEQIPDAMAASTVQTQATEQLQIIQQRILTRDTLVDMANRLQIYATPSQSSERMDADEMVKDLRKRIKIVTTGGAAPRGAAQQATLVTISVEAPTAALAASVTNDIVTQILKIDVEMRTGSARQTLDFFAQDVDRLNKDMTDRGAAILAYKNAHKDALPDSLEFHRTQQATAQQRLLQLQQSEADLQSNRARLVRLHDAAQANGGTVDDGTPTQKLTPEQQQLRALHDQLTAQQTVLSPENPKVKMLQTQIEALQKVVDNQAAPGLVDAQGKAMSAYDMQLADLDTQLAQMETLKTQIEADIQTLEAAIDATPGNAIALDALQRDYDNLKAQYDQAVTNKARAATGDTIETMAKGQRITVIEQAVAPRDPSRPNRPVIAAGGIGGGLALGLALVVLIEFLHAGIRRPAELTAKLGITTFATLPYLTTDREIRWRRLRQLIWVLLVLAVIAAVLWGINRYYMPLDLLMDQVIKRISLLTGLVPNLA